MNEFWLTLIEGFGASTCSDLPHTIRIMGKRKGTIAKESPAKGSPTKAAKISEGDYMKELSERKKATLTLADGTSWTGFSFGADTSCNGEVRFSHHETCPDM